MICVIAGSTTLEYALRSAYENTLGRISWATSSGALTAQERYGAQVAQDYVDFIRKQPWYLYDFSSKLAGLWSSTPAWGPDMLRKWERRYAAAGRARAVRAADHHPPRSTADGGDPAGCRLVALPGHCQRARHRSRTCI
jgi:hypothetical protein